MAARAQYGKQRQALPGTDDSFGSKNQHKTTQNADIPVKTPIVSSDRLILNQIQAISVEKQAKKRSDESPWHPSQGSAAI